MAMQKEARDSNIELAQPFYDTGVESMGRLSDLLGLGGGSIESRQQVYNEFLPQFVNENEEVDYAGLDAAVEAKLGEEGLSSDFGSLTSRFNMSNFEEDPGYQYRQDEANKALERSLSAQGVTLGGGGFGGINPQVAQALQAQNQNMASQEYGNAYNRYNNEQLNQYNMLSGAANFGTTGLGSITGSTSGYATNAGNLTTGLAQAQMSANVSQAAQPSMFEQLLPVAGRVAAAAAPAFIMSDRRLKENIVEAGTKNGHKLYSFSYIGDDKRYIGVMAQEVQETNPEAVGEIDGYLAVDYDAIGLEMRSV